MITKDEVRKFLKAGQVFRSMITFNYIPEDVLYSTEELYGLYYSGQYKMEIGKYYSTGMDTKEITNDNFEEIIDDVYFKLKGNISQHIFDALENLELDGEYLKYFDDEPEMYEKFKKEVLKLKNNA